jgi:hypothetical protein
MELKGTHHNILRGQLGVPSQVHQDQKSILLCHAANNTKQL